MAGRDVQSLGLGYGVEGPRPGARCLTVKTWEDTGMAPTKAIRVVVDHHPIMRDALQDEGDFEVVGLARAGLRR